MFEKYITEWYSSRQLADQKNKKEYRVQQNIQYCLDQNRITCIDEVFDGVDHIMIDGYWLPGKRNERKILLVYYAHQIEKVIWFSIRDGEKKEYIREDLRFLRDAMGYKILSCTSDGWIWILAALKEIYPECIIQRCLVHIQRQVRNYISWNPKTPAGKELLWIMNYSTFSDPEAFPKLFANWKQEYFSFLIEKSISRKGWWIFTHTSLRKAMRHIENALPYMFQSYVYNVSGIERTSNKIEWYFWVFAEEWIKEHKGLSECRLYSFVAIWIYLRNQI